MCGSVRVEMHTDAVAVTRDRPRVVVRILVWCRLLVRVYVVLILLPQLVLSLSALLLLVKCTKRMPP